MFLLSRPQLVCRIVDFHEAAVLLVMSANQMIMFIPFAHLIRMLVLGDDEVILQQ